MATKTYSKNPLISGPKRVKKVRSKRRKVSRALAKKLIAQAKYRERVKAMRPYFGDVFKAGSGYDLRKVSGWSPADKARVTKYWEIIAPQIARPHTARFYKRKDHLREAIAYTQQEAFLKGQKAALISAEPGEDIKVSFTRRGSIRVRRQGVMVDKAYFDLALMIEEPVKAIENALLELPSARRYKLMMGPHESRGSFTATGVIEAVLKMMGSYGDDKYDSTDAASHYFENWLIGIVAYHGMPLREIDKQLRRERLAREDEIQGRKHEYEKLRALARKKATKKKRKTKRKKKSKRKVRLKRR